MKYQNIHTGEIVSVVRREKIDGFSQFVNVLDDGSHWCDEDFHKHYRAAQHPHPADGEKPPAADAE